MIINNNNGMKQFMNKIFLGNNYKIHKYNSLYRFHIKIVIQL